MDDYLNYERIAKYAEFAHQPDKVMDGMARKLISSTLTNSKKYSVPILYVSPMCYTSPWSKRLRNNGALLFKYWDRPVNCLSKVCEYADFRRKMDRD